MNAGELKKRLASIRDKALDLEGEVREVQRAYNLHPPEPLATDLGEMWEGARTCENNARRALADAEQGA